MTQDVDSSARIYTLDVLRGIAALSVVFWHWQHFFYVGDQPTNFEIAKQPFFEPLALLYKYGALAVELFFCISGFVFFCLFFNKIARRRLSAAQFFMDRFSRLYPLHIVTFAAVALLQFIYSGDHSTYFIYQANDAYHALLNLLLIPAWGFETGWSFNGPVWSVSVEMFLYGLFFVLCLTGTLRYLLIPCLLGIGYLMYPEHHKLAAGIVSFFSGGIAFLLLDKVRGILGNKTSVCAALGIVVLAWGGLWFSVGLNSYYIMIIAFPASVMFVASLSFLKPDFMKSFAAIGDLSYSSYLLHFPLQIAFAMVVDRLGYSREIFYSPWMLGLFMATLIPLSFASHRFFEIPAQQALRAWFRGRAEPKPDIKPAGA